MFNQIYVELLSPWFSVAMSLYFFFFWLRWVFAAARAFSSCGERASHCGGFSCCRAQALGAWASVVVAHGL